MFVESPTKQTVGLAFTFPGWFQRFQCFSMYRIFVWPCNQLNFHSSNIYFFHQDSMKKVSFSSLDFCFGYFLWPIGHKGTRCEQRLGRCLPSHTSAFLHEKSLPQVRCWFSEDERHMQQIWIQPTAWSLHKKYSSLPVDVWVRSIDAYCCLPLRSEWFVMRYHCGNSLLKHICIRTIWALLRNEIFELHPRPNN